MLKLSKLLKLRNLVGVISLLTNINANAHDYIVPHNGPALASISDKGVNRIAIENDRIAQVIGNEDEYIIESDANLGQIFLTPVLKEPHEINLRLVTERDKIIDTKFKIKKIEPQTINFKYKSDSALGALNQKVDLNVTNAVANNSKAMNVGVGANHVSDNTEEQKIINNLKLAHNNILQSIKLPQLGCLKQNTTFKGLKLIEGTQYSLNKQIILKVIISNASKGEIVLNEADFASCMKIVKAVSIDTNQLAQGMNATIYMVGNDGK
jgi:hypothetical protein